MWEEKSILVAPENPAVQNHSSVAVTLAGALSCQVLQHRAAFAGPSCAKEGKNDTCTDTFIALA